MLKLIAGNISTNKFTVQSDNGNLKILGDTIKLWDASGHERISLGLNSGDYNLLVRGMDGATLLFGTAGVTKAGITSGAVDDSKIDVNANINGAKIEKESLVSRVNGATTLILASQVKLNTANQTLEIAFNSLSTTVTSNGNTVISQGTSILALQGSIVLKSNQTSLDTTNTNVTTAQTTANTATSNIVTLTTRVTAAELKITPDTIIATVSSSAMSSGSPVTAVDDVNTSIFYSAATWVYAVNASCYNSSRTVSSTTNDYLQYTFLGTGINVYAIKLPTGGFFEILIDGVSKGVAFDTYASVQTYKVLVYTLTGLTYGSHVIRIRVTGTRNASSTGYSFYFDYFEILNSTAIDITNISSKIQQSASDVQIAFNSINSAKVTINSSGLSVTNSTISGDAITGGTITAVTITGVTIVGGTLKTASTNNYTNITNNIVELYQTWTTGAGSYNGVPVQCCGIFPTLASNKMELLLQAPSAGGSLYYGRMRVDVNGLTIDSENIALSPMAGGKVTVNSDILVTGSTSSTGGFSKLASISAFNWNGTIVNSATQTITHNLGYKPIVSFAGNTGNIGVSYSVTNTTCVVTVYNTGANSFVGYIYFW